MRLLKGKLTHEIPQQANGKVSAHDNLSSGASDEQKEFRNLDQRRSFDLQSQRAEGN